MATLPGLAVAASAAVYVAFLGANYSFLGTLWRQKGWLFLVRSFGATTADSLAVGFGILAGLIGYAAGQRY